VPQLRQVARNGGLRLPKHGDQFTDTQLWPALGQEMDYAQAGAIGQRAQQLNVMHVSLYAHIRILFVVCLSPADDAARSRAQRRDHTE